MRPPFVPRPSLMEVSAVFGRMCSAVAVLAAAAVAVLVRRDRRRLEREAVAQRLMAGCAHRDTTALAAQLADFRLRLEPLLAEQRAEAVAGLAAGESLSIPDPTSPPTEGGTR